MITLIVIGVIAALTVPALMQNIQDAQLKSALKKSFTDLSAATQQIFVNQQDIPFNSSSALRANYERVMSFIKQDACDNTFTSNYFLYKNPSVQVTVCANAWPASAITPSGAYIGFGTLSSTCDDTENLLHNVCAQFTVDVNGNKQPNMIGKDLFYAWLVKTNGGYSVYAAGSHGDGYDCEDDGSADFPNSAGCATSVLMGQNKF